MQMEMDIITIYQRNDKDINNNNWINVQVQLKGEE